MNGLTPTYALCALLVLLSARSHAQDFYQQGDSMSIRISSALSRVFGGGSKTPPPRISMPQMPSLRRTTPYQQPPAAATQQRYIQPGQPQQPIYRQAPPAPRNAAPVSKPKVKSSPPPVRRKSSSSSSSRPKTRYTPPIVVKEPEEDDQRESRSRTETLLMAPKPQPSMPAPQPEPAKAQTTPPPSLPEQKNPAPSGFDTSGLSPFREDMRHVAPSASEAAAKASAGGTSSPSSTTVTTTTVITNPPTSTSSNATASANSPAPEPAPAPTNSTATPQREWPKGTPGSTKGFARSPYPPYHELEITGLPSGSLALDPTVNKVFRVP